MLEDPILNLDDYKIISQICNGSYSNVSLIINKETKQKFTAQIFKENLKKLEKYEVQQITREAQFITQLYHPSIVRVFGYNTVDFRNRNRLVLITEYRKRKTLADLLKIKNTCSLECSWDDTAKLINIFGIASGMSYLHSQNILHYNLKPSNILENNDLYPKICNYSFFNIKKKNHVNDFQLTNIASLDIYQPPEINYDYNKYDKPSDVYSFAMICYTILLGDKYIYKKNIFSIFSQIHKGIYPQIDSSVPKSYERLIRDCWKLDVKERPTFDEIVDRLKNDRGFITSSIDEEQYRAYIEYIETKSKRETLAEDDTESIQNDSDVIFDYSDDYDEEEEEPLYLNISPILDLKEYERREKIGSGNFGNVFKIKELKTGHFYAAKIMKKVINNDLKDTVEGLCLRREVKIFSTMIHPSIVKFIGYSPFNFKGKMKPSIIIEYLKNDSLEELLNFEREGVVLPFWNDTMRLINIYGVAVSMKFLHSNNIIHRDLKPGNIILDKFLFPKLSDFGFSMKLKGDELFSEIIGTPAFIAPEIHLMMKYSKAGDVYAFGMLVYEIMCKKFPFEGLDIYRAGKKVTTENKRPEISENVPQKYKELIEWCWQREPEKRPTFEDIVNDLVSNIDYITEQVDRNKFNEYINYIQKKCITKNFSFKTIELQSIYKEHERNYSFPGGSGFISLSAYEKKEKIKNFALSSVYKVKDKMTGYAYSAKIANVNINKYSEEEIRNISEEVQKLSKLNHPSIQKFYGFSFVNFDNNSKPVVVNEYLVDRTLHEVVKIERKGLFYPGWNDTKKLINIYGIASAMQFLHKHGILHPNLDLKSIYIDDNLYPKLSQIGYFTQIENSKFISKVSSPNKRVNFSTAPEVMKSMKSTELSDVYSYSFFVYQVITNEVPFKNVKNLIELFDEVVNKKTRPVIKKSVPMVYHELIESCWSEEPSKRPTFDVIVDNLRKNTIFISNNKIDKNEYLSYIKYIDESINKNIIE